MDKKEAKDKLNSSRDEIDKIDKEIINLIIKRTSYAQDIVLSKKALGMDILDSSREELIHEKVRKLTVNENIDTDSIISIIDILVNMSKKEQNKYL